MNLAFPSPGPLAAEIRYARRTLSRSPMHTATAVLTLALGIGANALIFCFANALFLRPLPFPRAQELVGISTTHRASNGEVVNFLPTAQDLVAYASRSRTLAGVGGIDSQNFAVLGPERPETVAGALVTASLWSVLGTPPAAGRIFTEEEDRPGSRVAIISAAFQQRRFPGPPEAALGRSLTVNGEPRTIIGVMPPRYQPRMNPGDLWLPMGVNEATATAAQKMQVAGRLRPGVTVEAARLDLSRIAAELAVELPQDHRDWGVSVTDLREKLGDTARAITLTLVAAVFFLLLLTCANVSNLALLRAAKRQSDVSIRLALGASPASIARHQFLEALMVSLAGGLLGTLIAASGVGLVGRRITTDNPLLGTVSLDGRVLALVALLSIATGVACSVVPGLHGLRLALGSALGGSGSRQLPGVRETRLRRGLMRLQVGVAALLLLGSASAILTLKKLGQSDPGLRSEGVMIADVTLQGAGYATLAERSGFAGQVLARVRQAPGVESASMVTNRFVSGESFQTMVTIDGRADPEPLAAELRRIDPAYFTTLGVPLLQGRAFTEADRDGNLPVAIVNRALARRYLGDQNPLQARIKRRAGGWISIVGVVPDVSDAGVGVDRGPMLYLPFAQVASPSLSFVIRSHLPLSAGERLLREAVSAVDPGQPVDEVAPLARRLDDALGESRFKTLTLGLLSGLALLVACLGIYGVTACAVAERTRELAVRQALGASPSVILRSFLGDTARLVGTGTIGGLIVALVVGRTLQNWSPEVADAGTGTYFATAAVLMIVSLLATLGPTLRASSMAPAPVLRGDR